MNKINPIFKGSIKNAQVLPNDMVRYHEYLESFENGTEIEIVVRKPGKPPRSNPQNRYYFGVILPLISDHTGHTKDEIHECLKYLFLLDHVVIKEQPIPVPRSTSSLDTSSMEQYLTEIREWASLELGIYLPLPNEAEVQE